jgi:hypothetical protein
MSETKRQHLDAGLVLAHAFCAANELPTPPVQLVPSAEWRFGTCAYYRPVYIAMCIEKTAHVGTAGMQWSYPGYITDRTPYGVVAHEIGHHADVWASTKRAAYWGDYSAKTRAAAREPRLTSYAPNDAEWFAEMFRLFLTNPDLLSILRPRTYELLRARWLPVVVGSWEQVLQSAPQRTRDMAARKVEAARRGQLS